MRLTICVLAPALLGVTVTTHGQEKEPRKSDDRATVSKEVVRGEWRLPGDKLVRITGKVKVLNAHALLYEDGTEVDLNGGMDAPDLEQKGLIGDTFYPCGKEAAEFLKKLIGEKTVTCYIDTDRTDRKKYGQASAFVGETNLNLAMIRNGWAMANHSGTAAWEAIARENQRGLWRGTFVFPERWRKGERLPGE
jgi:endonuclease YncB( thermonuclease family)